MMLMKKSRNGLERLVNKLQNVEHARIACNAIQTALHELTAPVNNLLSIKRSAEVFLRASDKIKAPSTFINVSIVL